MKKLITLILLAAPCLVFSQAIHLPDAYLPPLTDDHANTKGILHKDIVKGATGAAPTTIITPAKTITTVVPATTTAPATTTTINTPVMVTTTVPATTVPATTNVYRYSASLLNTSFTLPIVRVNFLVNKPQNGSNSLASTSFFNSVGAGVNYSWGEIDRTQDSGGNDVSVDYYNHYGFSFGFLFAANSAGGTSTTQTGATTTTTSQSTNIFAIVGGFTVLNFQVGAGYELGSLAAGQRRVFMTIAYAIPMTVLIPGAFKIYHAKKIADDAE